MSIFKKTQNPRISIYMSSDRSMKDTSDENNMPICFLVVNETKYTDSGTYRCTTGHPDSTIHEIDGSVVVLGKNIQIFIIQDCFFLITRLIIYYNRSESVKLKFIHDMVSAGF